MIHLVYVWVTTCSYYFVVGDYQQEYMTRPRLKKMPSAALPQGYEQNSCRKQAGDHIH